MRTKNFNLKKKIAFIASVTMIATTAAYLPAEVAQNIGIGSGIVASADSTIAYTGITAATTGATPTPSNYTIQQLVVLRKIHLKLMLR